MTAAIRTKAELVANYRNQLKSNLSDALDGLMIVFYHQRDDEIATDSTHHKNHTGFNKSDAKVLSQIAKNKLDGKDLDDHQISEVSRRMPKYAWQIITSKIHNGQFIKCCGMYTKI
jgi:hypothetical protein